MSLLKALGLPQPRASKPTAADAPTAADSRGGEGPRPAPTVRAASSKADTAISPRLRELARWPQRAHMAWKGLSTEDRFWVLHEMGNRYGAKFAAAFFEFTKGGARLDGHDYVTSQPHQTPAWFEGKGYKLADRSDKQQWWVHPSGHQIYLVMDSGPPPSSDLDEALRMIEAAHAEAMRIDDQAIHLTEVLLQEPVFDTNGMMRPPPPPSKNPQTTFEEYLGLLDAEAAVLDAAIAKAAEIRPKLKKKGFPLQELDEVVEQKLTLPRKRVDELEDSDRLDGLDPSKK